jgi:hypothetical protein
MADAPDAKAHFAKIGERMTCCAIRLASRTAFLPDASIGASMVIVIGTRTVGMVVLPPLAGSAPSSV